MKKAAIFFLLLFPLIADAQKYKWSDDNDRVEYFGWSLNSNFVLPGIRFNTYKKPNTLNAEGAIEYFNSIGAGIGIAFGKIKIRAKESGSNVAELSSDDLDITMSNIFGISAGILFSQNNIDSVKRNIFAPTLNLQVLDFQIGVGYELGDVGQSFNKTFVTMSYSIPLQKLSNVGSVLLSNPKEVDDAKAETKIKGLYIF